MFALWLCWRLTNRLRCDETESNGINVIAVYVKKGLENEMEYRDQGEEKRGHINCKRE